MSKGPQTDLEQDSKMNNWLIFEDDRYENLLPLVYFRPVWELKCGILSLEEKIARQINSPPKYLARDYLQRFYLDSENLAETTADTLLWINGRWLAAENELATVANLPENTLMISNDQPLAFRAALKDMQDCIIDGVVQGAKVMQKFEQQIEHQPGKLVDYPWDIISENGAEIVNDYSLVGQPGKAGATIYPGVHLVNESLITIGENATLKPGVVVDAESGPVWIDEGATIMAGAVLQGPLYIGKNSTIKIAAKIYENTTIGPVCKIGGEVEGSIIHGYSNKQHDGFLGHAYLGEWVNLGADTNNSDLKNNYGDVAVFLNGRKVDSGQRFVGLMMGDHSKCAINTMFNTGTVVGVSANIFGSGMPPKFVPSFSWGGAEGLGLYNYDKAIQLAETVMGRRKIEFNRRTAGLFEAVRTLASRIEQDSPLKAK